MPWGVEVPDFENALKTRSGRQVQTAICSLPREKGQKGVKEMHPHCTDNQTHVPMQKKDLTKSKPMLLPGAFLDCRSYWR